MPTPRRIVKALGTTEPVLAGVQLRPFMGTHFLCLEHIQSPVLVGGRPTTLLDVAEAILVCSTPAPEAWALVEKRRAELTADARALCDSTSMIEMRSAADALVTWLNGNISLRKPSESASGPAREGGPPDPTGTPPPA